MQFPRLTGNISIIDEEGKVVIAGDPEGLRSLASLITWLADVDQATVPYLPDGKGAHVHVYPGVDISRNSREAELCRLDAKGTGAFPEGFTPR